MISEARLRPRGGWAGGRGGFGYGGGFVFVAISPALSSALHGLPPRPARRSAFSGNRDRRRRWPRWRRWRRPSLRSTWRSRISSCSASGDAPTRPVLEDDRDYRRVSASPAQFRLPSSSMLFSPWPSPGRPQPAPGALRRPQAEPILVAPLRQEAEGAERRTGELVSPALAHRFVSHQPSATSP